MSELKAKLQQDLKDAMRNQDVPRREALRFMMAALKQKEVDERVELTDTDVLAILDKMSKQRRDSMAQFTAAGREDLAVKEQYELELLQTYLPTAMTETEISTAIQKAIQETGATAIKDMGKVMGVLKPQLQGRADLGEVSRKVKDLLN